MRAIKLRLQLAWSALTGARPTDAFAARLLNQRDTAWGDLDDLTAAVLSADDLETAKRAAAIALRDREIGGNGHTWSLARDILRPGFKTRTLTSAR